jgi:hypothetical protein
MSPEEPFAYAASYDQDFAHDHQISNHEDHYPADDYYGPTEAQSYSAQEDYPWPGQEAQELFVDAYGVPFTHK